jgi:type I restriction enzyme S subunit
MTMAKQSASTAVPTLRFPEFRKAEAWDEKALVEACEHITQGGTPDTSNSQYWDGAIAWLTPAEMGKSDSPQIASTTRTITEIGLANCSSELLPEGSVIISTRAPIGHLAINTVPMAINQGCKGLIPGGDLDRMFLLSSLSSAKSRLIDLGAGNTFKELSASSLKNFVIPIPRFAEQQKIADCLTSLDEVIAAQGRKVEALKTHKRGLMQQLFPREGEARPRLRFPEFRNAPEWEARGFFDLFEDVLDFRGRTPKKLGMDWGGGDVISLSANNVKNGFIDYNAECNLASEELYSRWMAGANLEMGDIVFTMEAPLGKALLVPDQRKYILSQRVVAFKTKPDVINEFLIQLIWSDAFQRAIDLLATGSTAKGVSQKSLQRLLVSLPEEDEQRRIAQCLAPVDSHITAKSQQLAALKTHKQGLMQQLFPAPEAASA